MYKDIMSNKDIVYFFWKHIKPYKWHYMLMLFAPIVSSFHPFVYHYAIKQFIDILITKEFLAYKDLFLPIIIVIVANFSVDLLWRISDIAEWKSEPHVRKLILLDSYDHVQNHSYRFFQDNFVGSISSKLKNILEGYNAFWDEIHHGLGLKIFRSLVSMSALAIVNFNLMVFMLIWSIIYIPLICKLSNRLNKLAYEATESKHRLLGQISDRITNMVTIFSFATKSTEYNNLRSQISNDLIPKQVAAYKYDFLIQVISGTLYIIMFLFLLFYMIYLRMHNQISIGDFAFVFGIILVVIDDIWSATASLQSFSRTMGDLRSSISILYAPHQKLVCKNIQPVIINNPRIEFKNVVFSYSNNGNYVFNKLDLLIKPGEKIGVAGHSGAGKTTLINILLRYFIVNEGEIIIDNYNINDIDENTLRTNIAVIPQDTTLFHRTLMENIRYGSLTATDNEVIAASKEAHLHEFIKMLPEKYNTYVGERGIKLSAGQRQRVAIARAILKNAPIIILDEATSSLDSYTEKLIQNSLNLIINNKTKTVIAIAHRLSTLKHMDKIIVLEQGVIVEAGTHEQLISKDQGSYKKMWDLQSIWM